MRFTVLITTYQRRDGSTPELLKRALDSVFAQTYQNFRVIVIGDKYDDNDEFNAICSAYDPTRMYYENLQHVPERELYDDKMIIWKYAGCKAALYSIDKALQLGGVYACHLDHDDEWFPDHLSSLKKGIDKTRALWLCTKANYINGWVLPNYQGREELIPIWPPAEGVIHSSVCFHLKKIPLRYRDVYDELSTKHGLPGDADLWFRMAEYLKSINRPGCLVNKITVNHIEEGFERN